MIRTSKSLSITLLLLALVLGLGSVLLLVGAPLGTFRIVHPRWSTTAILFWDAALSFLFFVQHSGMIRKPFRAWLSRFLAPKYHPAVYAIASGIALATVVLLWQPSGLRLVALLGVPRRAVQGISIAGLGLFVWGARSLRPFDPLGLAPLAAHLRDRAETASAFVARGPYRWVRHPLYLAVLVLIWSCPEVTADSLLYAILWSAWIVAGAWLEERDLRAEFGEAYRAYCRDVPMLLPWPRSRSPLIPFIY